MTDTFQVGNAEIEHASPYGKDPGEKVPGEKKKIGARAKRAWESRRQSFTDPAEVRSEKLKVRSR